jgi:hypothetical protein
MTTFNNIESVRSVLLDIVSYIKSLNVQNIDENTRNELLKIQCWASLAIFVQRKRNS